MMRMQWLEKAIKHNNYKTGVELGVLRGPGFQYLIENCPNLYLTGVDIFYPDNEWKSWDIKSTEKLLETKPVPWYNGNDKSFKEVFGYKNLLEFCDKFQPRAKLIRDFTNNACKQFANNSIDFVFIDASHDYSHVLEDIDLWTPKVKVGGLISGHDLNLKEVRKAVSERNNIFNEGPDNTWWWRKK